MLKQICRKVLFELKTLQNGTDDVLSTKMLEGIATSVYHKLLEHNEHTTSSANEVWKANLEIRTNQKEEIPTTDDDVWIFGYGSLVWKADFPFIDRKRGFITGYQRHFFQHSIDHRGIPTKPGRVVTLEPTHKPEDRVYGMAYRIASRHKEDVLQHLDYREKNGYERCVLPFYEFPELTGISFDVIMYIATAENESYAGNIRQLSLIADQIFTSAGPSGPNREYLYHLAEAMRVLFPGVEDLHLFDLEAEVLKRQKYIEPKMLETAIVAEIKSIFENKIRISNGEGDNEKCVEEAVKELECLKARCTQRGWKEAILAKEYLKQDI